MDNLDISAIAYKKENSSFLENELILTWYPNRIIKRTVSPQSLLELGLGHGFTCKIFNPFFEKHVIIEGSKCVINNFLLENPNPNFEIIESFFENFETEHRFDVIVLGFILEHVEDPSKILHHYKKFLKPDGQLFVTVPNAKCLNRLFGLELGIIKDIYELNNNDREQGHKRQYCLKTLKEEIQNAGYKIVHEEGIYLKPLPLSVLKTLDRFEDNLQAMLKVGVDFPEISMAILVEAVVE